MSDPVISSLNEYIDEQDRQQYLQEEVDAIIETVREELQKNCEIYTDDGTEYSVTSSAEFGCEIEGCQEYMQFDNAIEAVESRNAVIDMWIEKNSEWLYDQISRTL